MEHFAMPAKDGLPVVVEDDPFADARQLLPTLVNTLRQAQGIG
jgi:hypothetical protein